MKLVIFGLSVSSSWGNGHATLWRGLIGALNRRGHQVVFFERNAEYYEAHRDLYELPGSSKLILYSSWEDVHVQATAELDGADVGMITSYCPDGIAASREVLSSRVQLKVFYDLDTPVTLKAIAQNVPLSYIDESGLGDYDLVLSYTGGIALDELRARLNARRVVPLYGSVDPQVHKRTNPEHHYRADLSYIGTYSEDRQASLEEMLVRPARQLNHARFLIAGAQYPQDFPWTENIAFVRHLPPGEHASFFSSSRLTLNLTRAAMAEMGWCPSGRLFEAAACKVPILSDSWPGIEEFYTPGEEILIANNADESIQALELSDAELGRMAAAAHERTLAQHTADCRARQFEEIVQAISPVLVEV